MKKSKPKEIYYHSQKNNFMKPSRITSMYWWSFFLHSADAARRQRQNTRRSPTILEEENSEIKVAKVDVTKEGDLAEALGVDKYPTVKFFQGDNKIDYTGKKRADEIIAWLQKKTGSPAQKLETVKVA